MRTAASVFISGTGIFEIAGSFCLQKKEGDGDNEQSKKSKVRIHVAGGIESKHGKEQKGINLVVKLNEGTEFEMSFSIK